MLVGGPPQAWSRLCSLARRAGCAATVSPRFADVPRPPGRRLQPRLARGDHRMRSGLSANPREMPSLPMPRVLPARWTTLSSSPEGPCFFLLHERLLGCYWLAPCAGAVLVASPDSVW